MTMLESSLVLERAEMQKEMRLLLSSVSFPGFEPLNRQEIENDVNEVQIGIIDSDTDCSVLSEDILPSSYPVKPRAHTKPVGADGKFLRRHTYGMRKEISSAEVDDAIGFLHDVNTSQRTLFDAELERENLESNYESLQTATELDRKLFLSLKRKEENYLRLQQSLCIRLLLLHTTYSRRNAVLLYLINAFRERKILSSPVLQTMAKIDEIFDEQRSSDQSFILKARIKTQEYLQQSVPFLRAKFVDSDQCIVLHVGQTIFGPMGCGTIQTIRPIDLKIVVKLSFGMMYCDVYEIATMIKLGKVCLPSSDIGLLNKFESLVNSYTNSFSERNEIAIATGLYDENVDTDIEDGPSGDVSIDDLGENGRGSFDLEGSILEQSKQEPSAATLEFDTYGTKYQNLSSEVQDSCFTRLSDQTPAHFRSKLHRKLSSNIYGEFTAVPLESLFLYFCPPACINEVSRIERVESGSDALRYCLDASSSMYNSDHADLLTPESVWFGDLVQQRGVLLAVGEQIKSMEEEQIRLIRLLEIAKRKSVAVSLQSANLRLSIFTRRVGHRNKFSHQLNNLFPGNVKTGKSANSTESDLSFEPTVSAQATRNTRSSAKDDKEDLSIGDGKPYKSNASGTSSLKRARPVEVPSSRKK